MSSVSSAESASPSDRLGSSLPRSPLLPGPYLVVGLGRAGFSAAKALAARCGPSSVRAWDSAADSIQRARAAELRAAGVEVELAGDGTGALAGVATLVKSPGVPPEVPVVAAARRAGIPVVDELEIGWCLVPAPIVGVTGTKGKSTVSGLCTAVLAASGHEPVLCGNTEFGPPLAELALGPPPRSLVAEISSYQLESSVELAVDAAVFTNLSRDHLNRHASMSAYGEAKRNLFVRGERAVPLAAINVDDALGARLAGEVADRGGRVLRYGRRADADYRIADCRWDLRSARAELATPDGSVTLRSRLPGPHNAANVAAALALADGLGLEREATISAIAATPPVPGRFEVVEADADFDVVVDFCISPVGVAAALATVRPQAAARGGRVIAVLAVLGRSATGVAPESGALARAGSDHLILSGTSYRGEARVPLLAALARGARGAEGAELEVILDRRRAIERAISLARPGDVVALLGRGDTGREATDLRGGFVALDDRRLARELIEGGGACTS